MKVQKSLNNRELKEIIRKSQSILHETHRPILIPSSVERYVVSNHPPSSVPLTRLINEKTPLKFTFKPMFKSILPSLKQAITPILHTDNTARQNELEKE